MNRVLRCKPGETVVLLDGTGYEYTAKLDEIFEDYASLTVRSKDLSQTEAETKVTLYQGMPKSQKIDTVVQKAVELGAVCITPFVSKRCVKVPKEFGKKSDRLSKIAFEAVKQSRRAIVPEIGDMLDFKTLVSAVTSHELALVCYEDEIKQSLKQVLSSSDAQNIAVIIGPEGGFAPEEIDALVKKGVRAVTLGPRILRTRNSCLAALAQIMYEKEAL